ncbi:MAG: hypothetical protein V3U98_03805 [Acidobacteriota bacterium]
MIELLKTVVNTISSPEWFVTGAIILFFTALYQEKLWTRKPALIVLAVTTLFFMVSLFDPNFRSIVTKPDNVPIVTMLFLMGYFVWLSMSQAYENDRRIARGEKPTEACEPFQKVLVWPDLVYIEFICLILFTVMLIVWSVFLKAPLEEPANPGDSPNPSKAPWYFLGLQEMLVYYDPWLAGVVFPSLIIIGLMAIPYIDKNPKGSGYFTFRERKVEITIFLFGFLVLWVLLIATGTFLRGPNWNFFGPFEVWDINKLPPLVNVNLSEYVWVRGLDTGLPNHWFLRELPGIVLVLVYLLLLPLLLARTLLRKYHQKLGVERYALMVILLLTMASLPIKMYLRWLFNLKYIVAIPEYFFNI